MRTLKTRLLGAAVVAGLAGLAVAADPALSADLNGKAIEADTTHLNKLVELSAKKKVGARLKVTAAMLALYADDSLAGKDAAKMATLRDEALKIAVKGKTPADVAKQVAGLPTLAVDAKASTKPLGAKKIADAAKMDIEDLMSIFGPATAGGLGLEKETRELKKDGVQSTAAAELLGTRTVALAELTAVLPNAKATGAALKSWEEYSLEMKKQAQLIATEAAKGSKADLAKIKTAAGKLDASCTNCHNKFRSE